MNDRTIRRKRNRPSRLDDLESSLDYLMSRFAAAPSVWVAQAVLTQLEILIGISDAEGLTAQRRATYRQLIPAWQTIVRRLGALAPAPA